MKLIGIDEQLAKVENFIRKWKEYKKNGKSAILLYGPQGTGKTSTAYYISKKFGFNLVEFNMGEYRTKEEAIKIYQTSITKGIIKKKLILLDEFDTLAITSNKNEVRYPTVVLRYIYKTLEETNNPIVITANEIRLIPSKIIEKCELVEYKRNQEVIKTVAKIKGVRTFQWIPSVRHVEMMKLGSMSYSVKTISGRVKYYFLSGLVKEPEVYDEVFSISLMENAFKILKGHELYEFIELLSISDLGIPKESGQSEIDKFKGRNYFPIDKIKFVNVNKNKIDYKIYFFEKIKKVRNDEKKS